MVLFGNYTLSNASNFGILRYYMKLIFVAPPYYLKLDENQRVRLMAIVQNTNLTQEKLVTELISWGKTLSEELQQELQNLGNILLQQIIELENKAEQYKFSPDAEPYGNRMKGSRCNKILILF
uniref:Uncharacterized protein n=1 Tax=Acrobeloides nanus TaxID=290746 RepID=A0A914CPZ6_9BILA